MHDKHDVTAIQPRTWRVDTLVAYRLGSGACCPPITTLPDQASSSFEITPPIEPLTLPAVTNHIDRDATIPPVPLATDNEPELLRITSMRRH
jgi:hypothetical protein